MTIREAKDIIELAGTTYIEDQEVFDKIEQGGKLLMAKVSTHEVKGTFHKIGIGIYLVDY